MDVRARAMAHNVDERSARLANLGSNSSILRTSQLAAEMVGCGSLAKWEGLR